MTTRRGSLIILGTRFIIDLITQDENNIDDKTYNNVHEDTIHFHAQTNKQNLFPV